MPPMEDTYKALSQYVGDLTWDDDFMTSFGVKEVVCKTALSFAAMMAIFIVLRLVVPR